MPAQNLPVFKATTVLNLSREVWDTRIRPLHDVVKATWLCRASTLQLPSPPAALLTHARFTSLYANDEIKCKETETFQKCPFQDTLQDHPLFKKWLIIFYTWTCQIKILILKSIFKMPRGT